MKLKVLILSVVVLSLMGCETVPPIDWNAPSNTESRVFVSHDDFKRITTFDGPNLAHYGKNILSLWAWKSDDGSEGFMIYDKEVYRLGLSQDPYFYDEAYDLNGKRLPVRRIDFDVRIGDSVYTEIFSVDVSRAYLESSFSTGIRIKVYGKKLSKIISIPGGYVQGFMSKFDQVN